MHSAEKMGSAFFSMLHILDRLPTGLLGRHRDLPLKAGEWSTSGKPSEGEKVT